MGKKERSCFFFSVDDMLYILVHILVDILLFHDFEPVLEYHLFQQEVVEDLHLPTDGLTGEESGKKIIKPNIPSSLRSSSSSSNSLPLQYPYRLLPFSFFFFFSSLCFFPLSFLSLSLVHLYKRMKK